MKHRKAHIVLGPKHMRIIRFGVTSPTVRIPAVTLTKSSLFIKITVACLSIYCYALEVPEEKTCVTKPKSSVILKFFNEKFAMLVQKVTSILTTFMPT